MRIERRFTKAGQGAYADIEFRKATSEIKNPDGSIVFRLENIDVPAQFSQVAATQELQSSFDSLATNLSGDQFVRAAALVGQEALVPSTAGKLENGAMSGGVNVGTSGTYVNVQIKDASGNVVRNLSLGQPDAGLVKFDWDGKSDDGTQLTDGVYQMSATSGGTAIDTFVRGKVEGVGASGTDGTYVQVAGYGGALLSQIAQIL